MGRAAERPNSCPPPTFPQMELRIQMLPLRAWGRGQGQDPTKASVQPFPSMRSEPVSPLTPEVRHGHLQDEQPEAARSGGCGTRTQSWAAAGTHTKLWACPPPSREMAPQEDSTGTQEGAQGHAVTLLSP